MLLFILLCSGCFYQFATAIPALGVQCLKEHNQIRARHGASALQWDPVLAQHAQRWAEHLQNEEQKNGYVMDVHERGIREGENVYDEYNPTCKDALEDWYDEYCEYSSANFCSKAPKMPETYMLHFTQMVWKKTTKMGVGIAGNYLVIRYYPKGNSYRYYGANVQCASKAFTNSYC